MRWIAAGLAIALVSSACAVASQSPAPSPTPLSLARDRAAYEADLAAATDAEAKRAVQDAWDAHLAWLQGVDRRAAAARATSAGLTAGCIDLGALNGCGAPSGGWLTAPDGPPLFWQIQSGATEADGITGGVVFLTPDGDRLAPVAWAYEGAGYDAPVVFDQDGVLYVAVPGITHGGRGDKDLIFRWTPGAERPLEQIDSWSWRDDLDALLPGLNAHGRIRIDYVEQVALVELWREGDAGCCGTGGHALIDFAIADSRLKAVEAKLRDR